jgi:hypothetical protein
MDKYTRKIIIIGSIITFIIVPIAATLLLSQLYRNDSGEATEVVANRSNKELLTAITSANPDFIVDNTPTIIIVSVTKPQNSWYVVTIRDNSDTEGTNPAKILLHDDGKKLKVLLGPGTEFPADVTAPLGIPSNVLKELNK